MAAVAAAAQAAVPAVAADFFLIVNTYTPVQKPAQGYFFAIFKLRFSFLKAI